MPSSSSFDIRQALLVLTDYQGGVAYRSTAGLAVSAGRLDLTLGSGTAAAVRGVSMSLPNLLQLLDADPLSGRAPYFSLPLSSLPEFGVPVTGTLELGAVVPLLASGVGGAVPIRIETDADHVTHLVVNGNQPPKIKDGVRIDLVDGIQIGSTRVDDLGQAWLDLRFLALFSHVTQGQSLLTTLFNLSEGAGRFFVRFGDLPISISGAPAGELQANVLLDKSPNFAPWLDLGGAASVRAYSAQAGKPLDLGADFFFGGAPQAGSLAGIDLVDPIANLATSTPIGAAYSSIDDWSRGATRPVLMAQPVAGTVRIAGSAVQFPSLEAVPVSLDSGASSLGADSGEALFVKLGGEVYRALAFDELSRLQFQGAGSEALRHPEVPLSFLIRDAQGAMSGEFTARVSLQSANVSGTVRYWASDAPLAHVAVTLQKSADAVSSPQSVESSAAGQWQLDGLDFDRFNAQASRPVESGEVQRALNSVDVLAALKLAVGRDLGPLAVTSASGLQAPALAFVQRLAADVNQDGRVGVDDADRILRVITGEASTTVIDWRFVSASALTASSGGAQPMQGGAATLLPTSGPVLFDATGVTAIQWLGVMLGDVDGGWRADAGYPPV